MALAEFWAEVAVRNPLSKGRASIQDAPHIAADNLDAALSQSLEWQFAGPFRGFDEADFEFLPEDKRRELSELVREFNGLASKLRTLVNRTLSNEGQLEEAEVANRARPLLGRIILLLQQDRYFSPDGLRCGKLVECELAVKLPTRNLDLRFLVGDDWSGDLSLWVWVLLPLNIDTDDGERDFVQEMRVLRPLLQEACRKAVPELFAYVSFRTTKTPKVTEDELEEETAGSAA